uniref:Synaptopodin 2-like a n=1 Tax=Oryzias sinensis TaxID=183150 RepID=A0A8C7YTT9_9TELE
MGTGEEVVITLSGGAPWGFRLQGGVEHQKPLQVAKVRKRSKACRAGLREADELVSINDQPCGLLSHAQAMNLIDSSPGILDIRVKRSEAHKKFEAYYGETDSDADVAGYERQRRQKRRSPSNSNPGKPAGRASPEGGETSEMSGYDSAPDAQILPRILDRNREGGGGLPGVARKEVIYKPPGPGMWSSQTSTETSSIISSADDQGPRDAVQEEDSGFLERANVPLVSPEKAKEALLLGSHKHVKEAKSKCRTIASLLTDAPNPHSKGVLMFKKRRQRSKKYTLTSFGSVDEDKCQDSQEEDGVFQGSESEFDEEGFSAVPDPTWDSDYLDKLEKRATAGTEGRGNEVGDATSPGLSDTVCKGAQLFEQQRKRVAEHTKKVEIAQPQPPPQSQAQEHSQMYEVTVSMVMSPPPVLSKPVNASVTFLTSPAPPAETQPEQPVSNVLNRTARPFTPGFISIRAATAPVTFRPTVTKRSQRPASAAVAPPPQVSSAPEQLVIAPPVSFYQPPDPPAMLTTPYSVPQSSMVQSPETSAAPTGRTGILLEARRRGGKPKPMFNIPDAKKNSPNPELLSMVQNLDDRSSRHKHGQSFTEEDYDGEEEERSGEADTERIPPPVAPKPRVIHENPQTLQAGGKGAQLFAKRQSLMGRYVVYDGTSFPSQWKYSPNVRAPPPIGYNPLMAPSIPTGPQRDANKSDSKGKGGSQKEGIKALDFMRRQPYQLNSAMFNYGGSVSNLSAMPSYQAQQGNYSTMVGSSLTTPRQIPLKTARVYEIKRFSTPTPMSAPTLAPKVIAPRSATTLGERLSYSGMTSPPPPSYAPTPEAVNPLNTLSSQPQPAKLPSLPKFSSTPISHPLPPAVPTPYTPVSHTTGLRTAKQFQSAPELSILASLPPLKPNPVQAPKPHFVATKGGVQPRVWKPGAI